MLITIALLKYSNKITLLSVFLLKHLQNVNVLEHSKTTKVAGGI